MINKILLYIINKQTILFLSIITGTSNLNVSCNYDGIKKIQSHILLSIDKELWERTKKEYNIADKMKNYPEMVVCARKELQIAGQDIDFLARAHNNLARALYYLGEAEADRGREGIPFFKEAVKEYSSALALVDSISDVKLRNTISIICNGSIAFTYKDLHENSLAEYYFKNAITSSLNVEDKNNLSINIKNLGSLTFANSRMKEYFTNLRVLLKSKKLYESAAWCDFYCAAASSHLEAIKILKSTIIDTHVFDPKEESDIVASCYKFLEIIEGDENNYEEVVRYCNIEDLLWQKHTQVGDDDIDENLIECRNNKARALLFLGEIDLAIKEFDHTLELKPLTPNYSEWNLIENNKKLAISLTKIDYIGSFDTQTAINLIETNKNIFLSGVLALQIGEQLSNDGRENDAKLVFLAAQSIFEKDLVVINKPNNQAGLKYMFLGALLLETRDYKKSVEKLEQARKIISQGVDTSSLTFCLPLLAIANDYSGQVVKANEVFHQSVDLYENQIHKLSVSEKMGPFNLVNGNTLFADFAYFLSRTQHPEEGILMADRPRAAGQARQAALILSSTSSASNSNIIKINTELWAKPISANELHRLLESHKNTLYLHYNVYKKGLILFVTGYKLPVSCLRITDNYPSLLKQINLWRYKLSKQESLFNEAVIARDLGKILLMPMYKKGILKPGGTPTQWKHLVIVPDGALHNIPFAALILPESGNTRLIERFPFSISSSLRQIARKMPTSQQNGRMLLVNDPTGGSRGSSQNSYKPTNLKDDKPLPALRIAFEKIQKKYKGSIVSLVGPEAQEEEVIRLLPSYSLLVFDTHGHALEESHGLDSYLTLAPDKLKNVNGKLKASTIMTLKLSAQLAILVACESAQGRYSGGEGNQGLVWSFWAAGCPSVVATLWPINSFEAGELIPMFLNNLAIGQPKDVSLQRAILTLRKSRHLTPGDWAAFQIYGDSTALPGVLIERTHKSPIN